MNAVGVDITMMEWKIWFEAIKTYNNEAMAQSQVINFSYWLKELLKEAYLQI